MEPVEHGQDLQHIQQRAGDPDRHLHARGDIIFDLSGHIPAVGRDLHFPIGQIPAQPATVHREQGAAEDRAKGELLTDAEKDQHQNPFTRDGKTVADGDKPHILFKADGADQQRRGEQQPEIQGKHHYENLLFRLNHQTVQMRKQALRESADAVHMPEDQSFGSVAPEQLGHLIDGRPAACKQRFSEMPGLALLYGRVTGRRPGQQGDI